MNVSTQTSADGRTQTSAAITPAAIHRAGFRPTLLRALDYLAGWATAELLMAILEDEPLLAALEQGVSAEELAQRMGSPDSEVTGALLQALHSEGAVVCEAGVYRFAEDLSELRAVHGWLELLMEGYRELFQGVGRLMREGDGSIERNHLRVATGSARIAIYDSVPLTLRLIERFGVAEGMVLDYGCGDASYLIALCAQHPRLRAIGVELAQETVARARRHVEEAGLQERITIEHSSAPDYTPSEQVDFVVSAFVLHEIVGQRGVEGTIEFLRSFGERFPSARLLIIEVSNPYAEGRGALVGSDRQGRGYYNYYIWLHSVTTQRLLPHAQWLELFEQAGYRVAHEARVDDIVDSTGLEIGYALERV
jgi:2-ketoarginine methyltransferase